MKRLILNEEELLRRRRRVRWAVWGTLALVLGAGGWFGFHPAGVAIKGWQARRHAARAMAFIQQENWAEAKTAAVEAYQLRFTEPEAVRAVARLLSRTGQGHEAVNFWRQFHDLRPDAAGVPVDRTDRRDEAAALLAAGEPARAAETVRPLLEPEENASPAELLLGAQIAVRTGRGADAARLAGRVLAAGNGAATPREALTAAALVLSTGAPAEAAGAAWTRIAELARGTDAAGLEALTLLARQALAPTPPPGAGDALPAPAEAARRLDDHPLAKTAHRLLAADLRARAEPERAGAELDAAVARFGAPDVDAETLATLGAWLASKGLLKRVLTTIPTERAVGSRELFLGHVDALAGLGRWGEVKRLLESDRFPLEPTVRFMYLARCGVQLGEPPAAIRHDWAEALAAAGTDVGKLFNVAEFAEKNGALDTARDAYAAARAAAPQVRAAYLGEMRAANALGGEGATARVHAVLAAMLGPWPDDAAIRNDEAYLRLLLNGPEADPRGAERTALELVAVEPASLPHRVVLALARLRQDRPAAALDAFAGVRLPEGATAPPSALAVHAAALAANGETEPARQEARAAVDSKQLRPEEQALIERALKEE